MKWTKAHFSNDMPQFIFNTLRWEQNGHHFPNNILKWIFFDKNAWISIKISLKFVHRGPMNNILVLVQIMAWRRPGGKPLSEPMMVRLLLHICITLPQWVKHNIIFQKLNLNELNIILSFKNWAFFSIITILTPCELLLWLPCWCPCNYSYHATSKVSL